MVNIQLATACLALASLVVVPSEARPAATVDERRAGGSESASSSRRSGPASAPIDFGLQRRKQAFQGLSGDELLQWTEDHRAGLRAKYASKLKHSARSEGEQQRQNRRRRRSIALAARDTATSQALVNYENDSTFYASVAVGTPPQNVNLVLDTGSSDMWTVQGKRNWNPAASSTFANTTTDFHITYGSGDVSGTLASDTVTLAGHTSAKQNFAIATHISDGLLGDSVEGIMGFGFEPLSTSRSTPFWQASGASEFSFYLAATSQERQVEDNGEGNGVYAQSSSSGGVFTLGGRNASLFQGDINWSTVIDETYWLITLGGLTVNGQTVDLAGTNKVAIDTGTTLIGAPQSVVEQVYSNVTGSERMSSGYYTFPCAQATNISATVHFGNQEYALSSDQLVAGTTDTFGVNCLGSFFDIGSTVKDDLQYIFGDAFLMSVYSIFAEQGDNQSSAAVGFASLANGLSSTTSSTTVSQVVAASSARSASASSLHRATLLFFVGSSSLFALLSFVM